MYTVNIELLEKFELKKGAFSGRTALVTGAARGIGEATAMTLAALGAQIIIVDMRPEGQAVADAIQKDGGQAQFISCDLSDADDLARMIEKATAAFGKVDILVNNAVYVRVAPIVGIDLDDWKKTFDTNVRAPFLNIKHLLPGMLERKRGVICNVIAYEGSPLAGAYAATKTASRSLALSTAREVGNDSGVSVFAFVPGIVDTPLIHETLMPQTSAILGLSTEQAMAVIAQNPGYAGLMPRDHCATALVYVMAHAPEYHAQVADPFEPLNRFGVIEMPRIDPTEEQGPGITGVISQHLKQYLTEVTTLNHELEQRIDIRTRELEASRARSEALLLNILPEPIAERLKQGEEMIADHFDSVTVLFADIADFTPLSARLSPQRVVEALDAVFSEFDKIAGRFELEKIKTVGDCYMMVGGLPQARPDHADLVAKAALEMVPALSALGKQLKLPLNARIGLHSGAVVAGVIGRQKFIYDLWGDTVNTASRMESQGVNNRIHCTEQVYKLLAPRFSFESRGEIDIKGKGPMPTYFLIDAK